MARIIFIGSKALGLSCLRMICEIDRQSVAGVVTYDDAHDGRSVLGKFRETAATLGLPLVVAGSRAEAEHGIREFRPDLGLVAGWYWIISNEALAQVPQGLLGLHNSLLPRYRGCAPLVWAIINGETQVGISLLSLTEEVDTGEIWEQRAVAVQFEEHIGDVLKKIEQAAIEMLRDVWSSILDGTMKPVPQDHSQATFGALRTPQDGRIDWTRPAVEVYNYIRAQSEPYPGAYTSISGRDKLTVWRARPLDFRFYGTPGQVAGIRDTGVLVVCGDNRPILVQQISRDDGPRVHPREVLRSTRLRLRDLSDDAQPQPGA